VCDAFNELSAATLLEYEGSGISLLLENEDSGSSLLFENDGLRVNADLLFVCEGWAEEGAPLIPVSETDTDTEAEAEIEVLPCSCPILMAETRIERDPADDEETLVE